MGSSNDLVDLRIDGRKVTHQAPAPFAEIALTVADGATLVPGDEHVDVVEASEIPRAVALHNRGPNDARFRLGADATGADTERQLQVGDRLLIVNGARFTDRVSVFAASDTTIEWETWS